jgi:hypothetical protein
MVQCRACTRPQDGGPAAENDSPFAFGDGPWQERPMDLPRGRLLLHLGRDRRRLPDSRALGELVALLAPFGIVRVHRNHAVNAGHVLEIRRRGGEADWEVKLEPPVNAVLPVGRTYLKQLWAAFGDR